MKVADMQISDPLVLEKIKLWAAREVDIEFLRGAEIDVIEDTMRGMLTVMVKGYVLGERLAEKETPITFERDVHFSQPATWWQHLKEDWNMWVVARTKGHARLWRAGKHARFGRIHLKRETRHIVQTHTVRTRQFATFPASPIRTPDKLRGDYVVRHELTDVYDG